MSNYSFLTSCYINSKANEFKIAMDSMLNQTLPAEQIVVVCDGQISEELSNLIDEYNHTLLLQFSANNLHNLLMFAYLQLIHLLILQLF